MWFWKNKAAPLMLAAAILALALPQNLLIATPAEGGGSSSFTSEAVEPYKVGALFAATGANAYIGNPEMQTVEMMEQQINASGGINGHPLEVIAYDYESDAAKCAVFADKLINQDNVTVIIGPTGTGDSVAIVDMAKEASIPLISWVRVAYAATSFSRLLMRTSSAIALSSR